MAINFDTTTIKQYETILGKDKMISLFEEYLNEYEEYMLKSHILLESNKLENLRIIYHSLCSASLVFGMKTFAMACSKIENDILKECEKELIKTEINQSMTIFNDETAKVKDYLGIL